MDRYSEYLSAAIQPRYENDPQKNSQNLSELVVRASTQGAKLVVLPECSSGAGYIYQDLGEALEKAEPIPGPFSLQMADLARQLDIYLVVGLSEREDNAVYNTAVLLNPAGKIVGKYRKNNLVSVDKRWFSIFSGGDNFPVWETQLGRIGILICGDARLPEIARCLALNGAEVLCYPTLWGTWDQFLYNAPTRAIENKVWIIASDKVGKERGQDYPGGSFIIDPNGNFLAKASEDKEEIIYAVTRPHVARDKSLKDGTDLFAARRPETYKLLVKPVSEVFVYEQIKIPVVPSKTNILAACIEIDTELKSKEKMTEIAVSLVSDAARLCSRLILLPELWLHVATFSPENWAESIPGPTSRIFGELAKREGVYIAYGAIESDRSELHKTTIFIDPRGEIVGKYRAIHLSQAETKWAKAGDDYIVCQTEFGKIGLMSGIDGYYFEAARSLALLGADAILWTHDFSSPIETDFLTVERAIENKVFMMAASKRGEGNVGGSLIVDPKGILLNHATSANQIIKAQIQLVLSRCKEALPKTDLILHRRPETYEKLIEPVRVKGK